MYTAAVKCLMASIGPEIRLMNLTSGQIFPHQLIYIAGEIKAGSLENKPTRVEVSVNESDRTEWDVSKDRFKCFVLLSVGHNKVQFKCTHEKKAFSAEINCTYRPIESFYKVKFIYITCGDSSGTFQTPEGYDNSLKKAIKLLEFNSLLCQLFFAECMVVAGYPRQTFPLAPTVEVFKSDLTESQSLKDDFLEKNNEIFGYFYDEMKNKGLLEDSLKVVAVLGCTRFGICKMLHLYFLASRTPIH